MKIVSRYILKEFLGNLILGLLIFTFVLLLDHFFELVDLLVNKGVGLKLTLELLLLLLPSSLSLTLPMSVLLAALLTYGRLSENSEITALKASGVAAWSYVKAPMAAALLAALFLFPFNDTWAPHAHAKFRTLYVQVLEKNPLVRIEEKTFLELGDYHLFVESKDKKTNLLKGVTIYKTPIDGPPLRIYAERGRASVNSAQGMTFDLLDGHIGEIDPANPDQWYYTGFQNYILTIPFQSQAKDSTRSLEEMDNSEISHGIHNFKAGDRPVLLLMCQRHLRWALAMTPLLFAALAIPLAVRVQRGGRSIGFGLSLLILMGYYVVIMGGAGVAERGVCPPWIALWVGNVIIAGLAGGLGWRFLQQ